MIGRVLDFLLIHGRDEMRSCNFTRPLKEPGYFRVRNSIESIVVK